tara:strand:+ start:85 stop:333 length:249 start_codon:yes stop_codon:yes gene_type:complete
MSIKIASHFNNDTYPDTKFINMIIDKFDIFENNDPQKISKNDLFNNKHILNTFIHDKKNKKENQKILIQYLNQKINEKTLSK